MIRKALCRMSVVVDGYTVLIMCYSERSNRVWGHYEVCVAIHKPRAEETNTNNHVWMIFWKCVVGLCSDHTNGWDDYWSEEDVRNDETLEIEPEVQFSHKHFCDELGFRNHE